MGNNTIENQKGGSPILILRDDKIKIGYSKNDDIKKEKRHILMFKHYVDKFFPSYDFHESDKIKGVCELVSERKTWYIKIISITDNCDHKMVEENKYYQRIKRLYLSKGKSWNKEPEVVRIRNEIIFIGMYMNSPDKPIFVLADDDDYYDSKKTDSLYSGKLEFEGFYIIAVMNGDDFYVKKDAMVNKSRKMIFTLNHIEVLEKDKQNNLKNLKERTDDDTEFNDAQKAINTYISNNWGIKNKHNNSSLAHTPELLDSKESNDNFSVQNEVLSNTGKWKIDKDLSLEVEEYVFELLQKNKITIPNIRYTFDFKGMNDKGESGKSYDIVLESNHTQEKKIYIEVKGTEYNIKKFILSEKEKNLMTKEEGRYFLILVTETKKCKLCGGKTFLYTPEEIDSNFKSKVRIIKEYNYTGKKSHI